MKKIDKQTPKNHDHDFEKWNKWFSDKVKESSSMSKELVNTYIPPTKKK